MHDVRHMHLAENFYVVKILKNLAFWVLGV